MKRIFLNKSESDKIYKNGNPYHWVGQYREKIRTQLIVDYLRFGNFKYGLDIGCGEGNLTFELAKNVEKIDAFDLSDNAIKRAKRIFARPNINYFQLDIKDFKHPKSTYDLIMCTEVLYYLKDDEIEKVFIEIGKSLSSRGIFVLATRVDGEFLSFDEVLELVKRKFQIINIFTVHPPFRRIYGVIRKTCNLINSSVIDDYYKALVRNIDPKNAFQAAFVCISN